MQRAVIYLLSGACKFWVARANKGLEHAGRNSVLTLQHRCEGLHQQSIRFKHTKEGRHIHVHKKSQKNSGELVVQIYG